MILNSLFEWPAMRSVAYDFDGSRLIGCNYCNTNEKRRSRN